jgi:hypothetical protein
MIAHAGRVGGMFPAIDPFPRPRPDISTATPIVSSAIMRQEQGARQASAARSSAALFSRQ